MMLSTNFLLYCKPAKGNGATLGAELTQQAPPDGASSKATKRSDGSTVKGIYVACLHKPGFVPINSCNAAGGSDGLPNYISEVAFTC